jgi:hypothetical protein
MTITSLLLLMAIGCSPKDSTGPAPKIAMRCFDVPRPAVVNDLRVRKPTEASKDLLIDRVLQKVYLYDYEDNNLTLVDREQWENATGVITDYGTALEATFVGPEVMATKGKLVYLARKSGSRVVPTQGKSCMRVGISLEGKFVAALTRDAPVDKKGGPPETNYVELFTYPGGEPVCEAFKLPFTMFRWIEPVCWSRGDTHLVISTYAGDKICIVELPDVKEEEKEEKREKKK